MSAKDKGGRPTKLSVNVLDQLEDIAGSVLTIKEACTKIGIDPATWYRWEANPNDTDELVRFRGLAARVRTGAGARTDELAWGVLRTEMENPEARPSDRIAAAQAALRLRTAHRVELTGADGGPIRSAGPDLSKLSPVELRELKRITEKAIGGDS